MCISLFASFVLGFNFSILTNQTSGSLFFFFWTHAGCWFGKHWEIGACCHGSTDANTWRRLLLLIMLMSEAVLYQGNVS